MISKKDFLKHFFASELWGWMQGRGFVQGRKGWLGYRCRGDLIDILDMHVKEYKEGTDVVRLDVSYSLGVDSKRYLAVAKGIDIDGNPKNMGETGGGFLLYGLSDSFIEEFEEGSWTVDGFINHYARFYLYNNDDLAVFWRLFPRAIKEHLLPWIEKVQTPEQLHALLPPLWADDPVVRLALLGEEPPAPTGVARRCRVMGRFGAITAVQGVTVPALTAALIAVLGERGVSLEADDEGDVELFEMPGWSLIYWPDGLCAHDQRLAEALSAKTGALVSSCNLYDDDLWEHALYRNGVELNRYRSVPDYHGDERKPAKLLDVWGGKPAVIAEAFGIDVSAIERYFEPEPPMDDEQEGWQVVDEPIDMDELNAKAYPDDEVEKSSPHLFAEFWRKVGITLIWPSNRGHLTKR